MPPPTRLLFLHPDAYGDLVLFEPVPRLVRQVWPDVEIAVLIRESYRDIVPLLQTGGTHWLTTTCDPYRESPGANPAALAALRETVHAFAPDCLVAACAEQTWLEPAVASFLPEARQISLGAGITHPVSRAALDAALPVEWATLYPEKILLDLDLREWEKNLRLAGALVGREVPRWWPRAQVPDHARECAAQILAESGLSAGNFVVCAAAGTANVQIKSWPGDHFGDTLAWLERERGTRALLVGHVAERAHLEGVQQRARQGGAAPALWTGQNGEMPVLAGLLEAAAFYFGNDTGAVHLAAALGRPVVPIFGGGTKSRFWPVARRSAVVVQPLPCFGCGWHCDFGDAPCVQEIPPDAVRHALDALLASDEDAAIEITVADAIPPKGLDLIRKVTETHRKHAGGPGNGSEPSQRALADLFRQLDFSETDRAERLAAIEKQGEEISRLHGVTNELFPKLDAAENARNLLAAQLADLRRNFESVEADCAARLQVIGQQGEEISRLHGVTSELFPKLDAAENARNLLAAQLADLRRNFESVEADREARAQVIETQSAEISRLHGVTNELFPKLDAAENARNLLAAQLADLRRNFESVEADCAARLQVIEKQGEEISRLHGVANELFPKLDAAENARNLAAAQLADLRRNFESVEADREARAQVIETQGTEISRLHAMVDHWLREAGELRPRLEATAHERNLLAAQIEDLRAHFAQSEADREARAQVIETQGTEISRLHAMVDHWLREAGELRPRLEAAQHESNLRAAQLADLRGHFENSEADRAARLEVIIKQGETVSQLQAQLAATAGEHARLAAEVGHWQTAHGELQTAHGELQATHGELQASQSHLQIAHGDLLALHDELHAAHDDLQTAHGGLRTAHGALTGEYEALRARKKTLDKHWTTWLLKRLRLWPR